MLKVSVNRNSKLVTVHHFHVKIRMENVKVYLYFVQNASFSALLAPLLLSISSALPIPIHLSVHPTESCIK